MLGCWQRDPAARITWQHMRRVVQLSEDHRHTPRAINVVETTAIQLDTLSNSREKATPRRALEQEHPYEYDNDDDPGTHI